MKTSRFNVPQKLFAVFQITAILVCHAEPLVAQNPPSGYTPPEYDNVFERRERRDVEGMVKGPGSKHYDLNPNNRSLESSPQEYATLGNPNSLCQNGENCVTEEDTLADKVGRLSPNRINVPLNIYAPLAGLTDTLYSKVHSDHLSSSMESDMVMFHATLLLTEPAVGSAVNAAMLESIGSVQTRYLAEDQMLKQLDYNPEAKEILLRAYQFCVAQEIRKRNMLDENGKPAADNKDKAGWIQAQSKCMGDRILSMADLEGDNFNELGGKTGEGFNFKNDPAYFLVPNAFTEPNENEIFLTDYLFNTTNFDKIGLSLEDLYTIKEDFRQFIGDYQFVLSDQTGKGGDFKRSASRELNYRKIPPTQTFEAWHRSKAETAWNTLMEMLKIKCSYQPKDKDPLSEKNLLCAESGALGAGAGGDDMFVTVSMRGYQVDCAMLDMMYAAFKEADLKLGRGSCAPFDMKFTDIVQAPKQAMRGHMIAFYLANKLAIGQIYSTLLHVTQIISNIIPTGQFSGMAGSMTTQLLDSSVGKHDFLTEYQNVLKTMNDKFRPEIQEILAKQSGKAVRKFADAIHVQKTGPGMGIMNPAGGRK